jgi:hypothetical protein
VLYWTSLEAAPRFKTGQKVKDGIQKMHELRENLAGQGFFPG